MTEPKIGISKRTGNMPICTISRMSITIATKLNKEIKRKIGLCLLGFHIFRGCFFALIKIFNH